MPIATPPTLIFDMATNLLETARQVLVDNGLEVPSHQFVSWHYPSWDCCDHLVIHSKGFRPSKRNDRSSSKPPTVLEADLILTFIGCAAVGDPIPADSEINNNARFMYTNAWTLYQGLLCAFDGGTGAVFPGCHLTKISDLQVHPPMGGCESFEITFTVQLS